MKNLLFAVAFLLCSTTTFSQTLVSYFQLDDSNGEAYNSPLKIIINLKAGTISIIDMMTNIPQAKYKIKYNKSVDEEDGFYSYYDLLDNLKYQVLKIKESKTLMPIRGHNYRYTVIFSKYQQGVRIYDFGFFCNLLD